MLKQIPDFFNSRDNYKRNNKIRRHRVRHANEQLNYKRLSSGVVFRWLRPRVTSEIVEAIPPRANGLKKELLATP